MRELGLALWILETSLATPDGYRRVAGFFAGPLAKVVLLGLAWAYVHHLLAGIRHVLGDIHIGLDLASARRSAAIVFVLAILVTVAIGVRLW